MSLLASKVQQAKDERANSLETNKESLEIGKLPEGFSAIELETRRTANIFRPKDKDSIRDESGKSIATYEKAIDKWVLASGISPDTIPTIANKETISNEQFTYMSTHAQYVAYSNPGPAFIQAQVNVRNGFGDDRLADEAYFAGQLKRTAEAAHRKLPKEIKDILDSHSNPCDPTKLEEVAMRTGTYAEKFRQDGNIRYSTADVMQIIYENVHRIPELENGFKGRDMEVPIADKDNINIDDR